MAGGLELKKCLFRRDGMQAMGLVTRKCRTMDFVHTSKCCIVEVGGLGCCFLICSVLYYSW